MSLKSGEPSSIAGSAGRYLRLLKPEQIIFTKNATEGLNILIKGIVSKGEHMTFLL
jgi:selenocysteine lyase/cysteine desulfurase